MKLKKKYKTKFDYSIRMFFVLSLLLFTFSLVYLFPKTFLTNESNILIEKENASLNETNDTLKAENGLLDDRYETMELEK